jgi:hypothetical protein
MVRAGLAYNFAFPTDSAAPEPAPAPAALERRRRQAARRTAPRRERIGCGDAARNREAAEAGRAEQEKRDDTADGALERRAAARKESDLGFRRAHEAHDVDLVRC